MTALPIWLIAAVGIMIAAISFLVGESLQLFFYVGVVFVAYAFFRWFMVGKKRKAEPKLPHVNLAKKADWRYCPNCGSVVNIEDAFCYKCGNRLRLR